ncbi:transcription termination factor Rho [uncultured Slackia sp.]|uniref:transcription termination factor Rho n=1 Tax=uncultured Slackia sp. TaxID=665903 RepID=UPI0026E00F08|nr:transcription termination factor Rho [uncultured Slackia sp.]
MISDEITPPEAPVAQQAPLFEEPAAAAAPAPAKRRPGRPRKNPVEPQADSDSRATDGSDESAASGEAPEKPAPRRRTRRAAQDADAASEAKPKAKPARATKRASSRKTAAAPAETAPAASAAPEALESQADSAQRTVEPDEAATPKRAAAPVNPRRRRTSKPTVDQTASEGSAAEKTSAVAGSDSARSAVSDQSESAKPVRTEEKPVVRKRPGRSTMLRAAVEASRIEEARAADERAAEPASVVSDDDAAQEKPARRRPGRPAKAKPAEQEEKSQESAVEPERQDAPEAQEVQARQANEHRDQEGEASEGKRAKREKQDRYESKQRERRQAQNERNDRGERRQDRQGKQNGERRQDRQNQNRDRNDRYDRNDRNADRNDHRRQRRGHDREPVMPKTTMEDLAKLKVAELREKAAELELDVAGLKKAELVEKVFEASVRAEGFIEVEGVLDIMPDGYGFLRTKGYLPSENDVYVGLSTIRRNGLRKGDYVKGQTRPARPNEKYAALHQVGFVNGDSADAQAPRVKFGDLTPVFPDECLTMEHGKSTITARVIDLVSPIGKGQRGLIVSPPKAGKTTVLKDIAAAITANNPEVHLMCLLVDERPEEVTDMQRSIKGEVIASTFDMPTENHIAVSELVIERAKRLVERGEDVVVLLDSLTRLARAYNLAQPASGRILSGGVDSTALYPPKRFLGAARNIEGGGSLTILASALIETGSKMDEVIFEEFKGTGNMELKLDRSLADRRVFPAIDPVASGTRREDLLLDPQEAPLIWAVRRILSNMNSTERAMDMLIKSLKQTNDNNEFLLRTAKKAQGNRDSENIEF